MNITESMTYTIDLKDGKNLTINDKDLFYFNNKDILSISKNGPLGGIISANLNLSYQIPNTEIVVTLQNDGVNVFYGNNPKISNLIKNILSKI